MKTLICLFFSVLLHISYAQDSCESFFGKLVINEVMPGNDNTATDENGEFDDWVEIHNTTDLPINVNGYFLSDNHGNKTKFVFPDVVIEANGFLIVWCDDQAEQGSLHASFKLSGSGEEVGLYNPDTTSIDYVRFPNLPDDISIGRFPDGHGPFKVLIPTFDSENINSVDIGLVINEYQAINETTATDQWGGFEDWIELFNASSQPISLNGYFLSDKIGDPTQFVFPDTTLAANAYMIIWCDQGLFDPGLHTFFKLGSDGDDILLSNADTITVDYVRFGPQIPDDTEGRLPNGSGSIECLSPTFSASNGTVDGFADLTVAPRLELWPNPVVDHFWVNCLNAKGASIHIFDIAGRLSLQTKVAFGRNRIECTSLISGIYSVKVDNSMTKFVKL